MGAAASILNGAKNLEKKTKQTGRFDQCGNERSSEAHSLITWHLFIETKVDRDARADRWPSCARISPSSRANERPPRRQTKKEHAERLVKPQCPRGTWWPTPDRGRRLLAADRRPAASRSSSVEERRRFQAGVDSSVSHCHLAF